MSITLISIALDAEQLPPSERFILVVLAWHAADDGSRCFPSVTTIAGKTGFTRRTVQRCLRRLEARGILEVAKRFSSRGTVEYKIRGDMVTPLRQEVHEGATLKTLKCDIKDANLRNHDARFVIEPSIIRQGKVNDLSNQTIVLPG